MDVARHLNEFIHMNIVDKLLLMIEDAGILQKGYEGGM